MTLIDIDERFDQFKITRWQHQLIGHALMTTGNLADLAMRIHPDYVRFHDGERRVSTNMSEMLTTDPTRRRLRDAIDHLDRAKTFVQIISLRSDPAYRALLDALLDDVLPYLPVRDRKLLNRDAAAFLASPGSVTPFHLDHAQNFLCHIRGAKTFYVWDQRDRSVVSQTALEAFYGEGRIREPIYQAEMQPKAQAFELSPGDCIYMPMGAPHAASTGGEITVTVSFLMNTQSSFELVEIYRANRILRRLGLSPAPAGASVIRDSLKRHTLGTARRVRNLARGKTTERRLQWY